MGRDGDSDLADDTQYIPAHCFILYRHGPRIRSKKCASEEEQLEFMLELLFDSSHPPRTYKSTWYP